MAAEKIEDLFSAGGFRCGAHFNFKLEIAKLQIRRVPPRPLRPLRSVSYSVAITQLPITQLLNLF
jgi:hypothetical protein